MDSINKRCAKLMAAVMEVDPEVINDDTSPENLDQWDSLSHVQLVLALEKEFKISITPEEGIEHFTSFKNITQYLFKL